MNPDISFLTLDPDLGSVSFLVIRSTGSFDHGELVQSAQSHPASGIIQPGGFSYTDQQTGEDKQGCGITVYTKYALTAGEQTDESLTLADEILHDSKCWRVVEVERFSHSENAGADRHLSQSESVERLNSGFCVAKAIQIKD